MRKISFLRIDNFVPFENPHIYQSTVKYLKSVVNTWQMHSFSDSILRIIKILVINIRSKTITYKGYL